MLALLGILHRPDDYLRADTGTDLPGDVVLQRPVRHARIGQRTAFIGHAVGEQAAHRVAATERMGNEANFVLIRTKFV